MKNSKKKKKFVLFVFCHIFLCFVDVHLAKFKYTFLL